MRNASPAFMRALAAGRSDYADRAVITLTNGTVLTLNDDQIWDNGLSMEDAVSRDSVFEVGAAIINQGRLVINNIYEDFDEYDFDGAKVVLSVGFNDLDDGTDEMLTMGTFTVDETVYNGSIITLTCLDNMSKFDKPYSTTLVYPQTLGAIVRDACGTCGVTLANNSLQFPHYDYIVDEAPSGEDTTFRQVISWAAQIACCFARCNPDGQLEIKWYNTSALDTASEDLDGGTFDGGSPYYTDGDSADGGTFNPWNTGSDYNGGNFSDVKTAHYISSVYTAQVSTDNVVITGVRVRKKLEDTTADGYAEYQNGTDGYVVVIEDNGLIQGTHGQDIADWLGASLNGLSFRKAELTHPSDPTMEAGDVAFYWDRKGNQYPIVVSGTTFTTGNSQKTVSSAETPKKNSMQRFTETTKNYVALRKQLKNQRTTFEQAVDDLSERIDNAGGLYCTEITQGGATKTYYHNKPDLESSDIQMLFSDVGFTLTSDGGETWYGMTVDGTMIAAIMNTIGINFDWGVGGTLTIKDANNNVTLYADAATGIVRIRADSFSLSDGSTINSIAEGVAAQYGGKYARNTQSGDTVAKTVSIQDFTLYKGAKVSVSFAIANTADNPTLNVSETGAKPIRAYGNALTADSPYSWGQEAVVDFVYDGSAWVIVDSGSIKTAGELADAAEDAAVGQLTAFINGDYADDISDLESQIDQKAETWYQAADPSTSWTTAALQAEHTGDLWYRTTDSTTWRWNGSAWVQQNAPDAVFDAIDGKAQIFVSQPAPPYSVGDLWFNSDTSDIMTCTTARATGNYTASDWQKRNKYTDNTVADEAKVTADTANTRATAKYGTCVSAASTAAKAVTLADFALYTGATISVLFTYANTAASPTLNVNGTGAKAIWAYGSPLASNSPYNWVDGAAVDFIYDGTRWVMIDGGALSKVNSLDTSLDQTEVFNRLTNNGTAQGIYIENGQLYILFTYAKGGTLTLGDASNAKGTLIILDASGNVIGTWDNAGISITKGSINIGNGACVISTAGKLTATGGDFSGKITSTEGSVGGLTLKSDYLFSNSTGWTSLYNPPGPYQTTGDVYVGKGGMAVGNGTSTFRIWLTATYMRVFGHATQTPYIGLPPSPSTSTTVLGIWVYRTRSSQYPELQFTTSTTTVDGTTYPWDYFYAHLRVQGNFVCVGTKSRVCDAEEYDERLLYAYETASPMFGDIGEGTIADDGMCYVFIDPVLMKTIATSQYQVFLQKYGEGDVYVKARHSDHFIVGGTPGLSFGWELKAKQAGYEHDRLGQATMFNREVNEPNYADAAIEHIQEIQAEREAQL